MTINKGKDVQGEKVRHRGMTEGNDDFNVCYHLFAYYGIQIMEKEQTKPTPKRYIQFLDMHGLEKLLKAIPEQVGDPDLEYLAIIVDANGNLATRWQSIRNILLSCGYTSVPEKPSPIGTIIHQEGKPTVGIWIMPNNELPGMLEDFCGSLIPLGDHLWTLAKLVLPIVIRAERRFEEKHQSKALIHTWLAWQEDPGRPMGQSISKGYFDPKSPEAKLFMQWICDLFEIEALVTC